MQVLPRGEHGVGRAAVHVMMGTPRGPGSLVLGLWCVLLTVHHSVKRERCSVLRELFQGCHCENRGSECAVCPDKRRTPNLRVGSHSRVPADMALFQTIRMNVQQSNILGLINSRSACRVCLTRRKLTPSYGKLLAVLHFITLRRSR